ncbi:MAG: hypothetical protein AAGK78_06090, partial [Planctomycetota bacterium]
MLLAAVPAARAEVVIDIEATELQILGFEGGNVETIDVEGQAFAKALRLTIDQPTDPVWDRQVRLAPVPGEILKGDVVRGHVFLRGQGQQPTVNVSLERNEPTWDGLTFLQPKLRREWTKVPFDITANKDYPDGSVAFVVQLGTTRQIVEVGGVFIENVTADGRAKAKAQPADDATGEAADLPEISEAFRAHIDDEAKQAKLPDDAALMIVGDAAHLDAPGASQQASRKVVDAEDQSFAEAMRVDLTESQPNPWDAYIKTHENALPIAKGDVIYGVYFVRADSDDESATGEYRSYLQRDVGDWTMIHQGGGTPGSKWSRRTFKTVANDDFDAGTVNYVFQMGSKAQGLEVGGLAIWNLGKDADIDALPVSRIYYNGQDPDAAWRAEAAARIDKVRKADLTVKVVDADDNPVQGADVRVELDRHAFGFGTWLSIYGPLLDEDANGEQYRDIVLNHFNRVTTPCYSAQTWGWPDPETRQRNIQYLEWASEQDVDIRAHTVLWSQWDRLPD